MKKSILSKLALTLALGAALVMPSNVMAATVGKSATLFDETLDGNGFVAATGSEVAVQDTGFILERVLLEDGKPYYRMVIDEGTAGVDKFVSVSFTRAFESGNDAGLDGIAVYNSIQNDTSAGNTADFDATADIRTKAFSLYEQQGDLGDNLHFQTYVAETAGVGATGNGLVGTFEFKDNWTSINGNNLVDTELYIIQNLEDTAATTFTSDFAFSEAVVDGVDSWKRLSLNQNMADAVGGFAATFDLTEESSDGAWKAASNRVELFLTQDITEPAGAFMDDFYFHEIESDTGAGLQSIQKQISDSMLISEEGFTQVYDFEEGVMAAGGSWTSPWGTGTVTYVAGQTLVNIGFTQSLTAAGFGDYFGFQELVNESSTNEANNIWWLATDKVTLLPVDVVVGQGQNQ